MTDHNAPTTPPPGPLPSTLPESEQPPELATGGYRESAALARAYSAACIARDQFEQYVRYLEGRLNGVDVDVAQSKAFEKRIEDKIDTLISMQAKLSEDVLVYVQKVVAVDFRQREHEHSNDHCDNAACEFRKLSNSVKEG